MNGKQFHQWANLVTDALLLVSRDAGIEGCNRAAAKLLKDVHVNHGENLLSVVETPAEEVLNFLRRCSRNDEYLPGSLCFHCKGGTLRCRADGVRVHGEGTAAGVLLKLTREDSSPHPFEQADGRLRIEALSAEIARRKKVEHDLVASELRTRAMLESLDDVVFEIDRNHTYANIWTTREDLLPGPRAEMLGKTVGTFMGHDFVDPFLPAFDRVLATGQSENVEYGIADERGQRWFLGRINPVWSPDGACRSVCFIVRDITERKRAEQSIRELSGKLLRVQDEERRRIARELHDDLAQILAGISLQLAIPAANPGLDPRSAATIREAATLAEQANDKVRNISHLLHPPLLDEVGLLPAVEWYVNRFSRLTGIDISLQASVEGERLSHEIESALFRVLQESLTNIYRHSGSLKAEVRMTRRNSEVLLEIEDYGRGFPPQLLQEFRAGNTLNAGIGLGGMRERLNQLGGELEIGSEAGRTIVRVRQSVDRKPSDHSPRFQRTQAGRS